MEPVIYILKAESAEGQTLKVLKSLHSSPIRILKFNNNLDLVMSSDENGILEFWDPETYGM